MIHVGKKAQDISVNLNGALNDDDVLSQNPALTQKKAEQMCAVLIQQAISSPNIAEALAKNASHTCVENSGICSLVKLATLAIFPDD